MEDKWGREKTKGENGGGGKSRVEEQRRRIIFLKGWGLGMALRWLPEKVICQLPL